MDKQAFEKQLNEYEQAYDAGAPVITDDAYDALVDQYKVMYGKYSKMGARRDQPLPIPAPSLDKIHTQEDVEIWNTKFKGCKMIMDKIDGYSVIVKYQQDRMDVFTHTDATTGSNINHLLPYLNLPKAVKINQNETLVVRGEMAIKLDTFEKYKGKEYTSPRNIIAQLNSKNFKPDVIQDFDFLAFQLFYQYDNNTTSQLTTDNQLNLLNKLGFHVVTNIQKVNKVEYDKLIDILENGQCDYLRDGLVLAQCEYEETTTALPKNKIAFKMAGETCETIVTRVEWNESKRLLLKPRVHYEPVFLDYANLSWANGLNARFINDNKIGPGTKIVVTRRGGVNPYIEQVIEGTKASMPEDEYEWNNTNVDIVIKMNDKVRIKRLCVFFDTLGAKYLGLKTIQKLYQHGFTTVEKIVTASEAALLTIPSIKALSAKRIVNQIKTCLENITLTNVMVGSCLFPGFGHTKITSILNHLPQIENILLSKCVNTIVVDDIKQVKGIDDTAEVFYEQMDTFIDFLNTTPSIKSLFTKPTIITPPVLPPEQLEQTLQGMVIVFSGDKKSATRAKQMGARVDPDVTKRTTLLVVDQVGTMNNKEKTCTQKCIPILSLRDFKTKYKL